MDGALKVYPLLTFALLAGAVQCSLANDNAHSRVVAAERCLRAAPIAQTVDEALVRVAEAFPIETREALKARWRSRVQTQALERVARDALVRTFTVDELDALTAFYSSKGGASAMKKFGAYSSLIMPAVQDEIKRVVQQQ